MHRCPGVEHAPPGSGAAAGQAGGGAGGCGIGGLRVSTGGGFVAGCWRAQAAADATVSTREARSGRFIARESVSRRLHQDPAALVERPRSARSDAPMVAPTPCRANTSEALAPVHAHALPG